MNWQISVAYEIESGSCDDHISGPTLTCDPEPCSGTVTYAWGAAMGGSITDVGYQQARPSRQPATSWVFGSEPPWEEGQAGSVAFGPDADPTLGCGQVYEFYIKADHQEATCGPIEATVWASCTACGIKAGL